MYVRYIYGLKRMSERCVTYNLLNDVLDLVVSSPKYSHSKTTSSTEEKDDEVFNVIFQDMYLKFKKRAHLINYTD